MNNTLEIPMDSQENPNNTSREGAAPSDGSPSMRPIPNFDRAVSNLKGMRIKHSASIASSKDRPLPSDNDNLDQSPVHGEAQSHDVIQEFIDQNARKLKRDIQDNLNILRSSKRLPNMQIDLVATLIADDYAEYLKSNEHDKELLDQLCEDYTNFGSLKIVHGATIFEEPGVLPENLYDEIIDLGGVLVEAEHDKAVLLNPEHNHIGLGIAIDNQKAIVVALISGKMLTITAMQETEEGEKGVEIKGKMLVDTHGLYAVRVQKHETKKDLGLIGPENIEFNPATKEFKAFVPITEDTGTVMKVLELYVRKNAGTIEYKQPRKEKINLNHLELAYRYPCINYPPPQDIEEDKEDRMKKEQKKVQEAKTEAVKVQKRAEEQEERRDYKQRLRDLIERGEDEATIAKYAAPPNPGRRRRKWVEEFGQKDKRGGKPIQQPEQGEGQGGTPNDDDDVAGDYSNTGEVFNEEEEDQEEDQEEEEDNEKQKMEEPENEAVEPENQKIDHELGLAIEEAQKELSRAEDRNLFLQRLACELRDKKDLQLDRQSEMGMTEGKYLNTLAHVHQIRQELKATQERYNAMARELKERLEEKQKNCSEIRKAFKSLMREVSKNAAFSKTDKPIGEKRLDEWDAIEEAKALEVQALRLENITFRNQLAKNQKNVKKKEELAEGLHLIDYEQLKIENQTLCEKIEERNEDLHRMKKNNANVVQVLTHIREKLQYESKMNEMLQKDNDTLDQEVFSLRAKLSELKKEKQKYKVQNEEIKQQTGIMTNKHLRNDFEKTLDDIELDKKKLSYLQTKLTYLTAVAQESARKNKWKKYINSPTRS